MFSLFRKKPTIVQPEVTVKTVLGEPKPVLLYEAFRPQGGCSDYRLGYYSSAAKAMEAHPSAAIRPIKLHKLGERYIQNLEVQLLDLCVDGKNYQPGIVYKTEE
jgi:hypothetical protein